MKKTLLTILTLTIGLLFVTSQALASPAIGSGGPKGTPPGLDKTPGAKATEHSGQHGKHQNFRGTIAAVDASNLTLTLGDGSSVIFSLTGDTRIKFPGHKDSGATLQIGMQAMVQAIDDGTGNLVALAVMAIPGQPTLVHRVGWVTDYSEGVSITIQASDGNTYTFALTGDTKILPDGSTVENGERVTIIAPRDPSALGWTALGIVVHPEGSGEGSMPPTATATSAPTEVPSETPTPP